MGGVGENGGAKHLPLDMRRIGINHGPSHQITHPTATGTILTFLAPEIACRFPDTFQR